MIKQSILLANLLLAVGIAEGHGLSSAVNIGISSPTLHLNNSGDISTKGTSEVTVTDGVPEDKVNFSIEGNGVLSATSATFDNNGEAKVTVTGQHPYSGIINVKALTDYGKKANTSLGISSPDITASNNGAISGKGSSVVTVTDGVPNDKLSFTIEGNGVLSATSATFDNNGNASVTVTGKHPYSGIINVKATTDYGKRVNTSLGISSPDITASNNGAISVKGSSVVTVTNGVPEDKVDFSIEGNGVLSATSAIFDNNGEAKVTVTGKHPYSGIINVKATTDYGKRVNTSLGISSPDITILNGGAISGKGSSLVTIKNGVAGDKVTFSSNGDGTLSATSATFDNNGNASVTVTGKHPYSEKINVKATTDYHKEALTSVAISSPNISVSNSGGISGKGNSTITVSNGVAGDKVNFFKSGNGTLSATSATFDNEGKASVTVTGKNPYSGTIGVTATTDYGKTSSTSLEISSPDITASNNGAISVKGSSVVTIKNGVAGDKVTFSSNGDGTLSATSATFDNNGNASVTVTGKHPYTNAINVNATTDYNKEASTSVAISAPAISVSNSGGISGKGNSTITVSNGVAGDKVNFSNSGNGYLSATSATFNNEGKASVTVTGKNPYSGTIGVTATTDYGKTSSTSLGISSPNISLSNSGGISGKGYSTITVSNGVAGDKVYFSNSGNGYLSASSATFNGNGQASVTVTGKNPYSGTIGVTATTDYGKTSSTSLGISSPNLSMSNSGTIVGNSTSTVTVSGGVAEETCSFGISSNGTLSASSATFNSNGQASVTVTGKNSGNISVSATTNYGKSASTTINVVTINFNAQALVNQLHFRVFGACVVTTPLATYYSDFDPAGRMSVPLPVIGNFGNVTSMSAGCYADSPAYGGGFMAYSVLGSNFNINDFKIETDYIKNGNFANINGSYIFYIALEQDVHTKIYYKGELVYSK